MAPCFDLQPVSPEEVVAVRGAVSEQINRRSGRLLKRLGAVDFVAE